MAKTLRDRGLRAGPVEVRACLRGASGGATACTGPTLVLAEVSVRGGSADLAEGRVSLHSGELTVTETDASVAGLLVTRTHSSRRAAEPAGFAGPGWTVSVVGGSGDPGMSDHRLTDRGADGYVLLVGPEGETLVFLDQGGGNYTELATPAADALLHRDPTTLPTMPRGGWPPCNGPVWPPSGSGTTAPAGWHIPRRPIRPTGKRARPLSTTSRSRVRAHR